MNNSCVVVLYFNKPNLTANCIQSIIDAGYDQNSVLAFDNGSLIDNFNFIKQKFPYIKHNRQGINKGYSGGFNGAIKSAINEGFTNFLFCSNDTVIYSETLEACLMANKKYNAAFIAPKIVYSRIPDKIDSIGGFFNLNCAALTHYKNSDLPDFLNPQTDYIPGTAFWLTKEVFEKLEGMDESFHTYWEDVDFTFRAHKNGIKTIRCYNAMFSHGVGKTCHKKPIYTTYYFQRNRIRFCKKYCTGKDLIGIKQIIKNDLSRFELKWKKSNDLARLGFLEELYNELSQL
jgi:GT2 family glycosyltransferase